MSGMSLIDMNCWRVTRRNYYEVEVSLWWIWGRLRPFSMGPVWEMGESMANARGRGSPFESLAVSSRETRRKRAAHIVRVDEDWQHSPQIYDKYIPSRRIYRGEWASAEFEGLPAHLGRTLWPDDVEVETDIAAPVEGNSEHNGRCCLCLPQLWGLTKETMGSWAFSADANEYWCCELKTSNFVRVQLVNEIGM